jgi:hypothetical protein
MHGFKSAILAIFQFWPLSHCAVMGMAKGLARTKEGAKRSAFSQQLKKAIRLKTSQGNISM